MSVEGPKRQMNRQIGFKLESSEKRKELEKVRIERGYSTLTNFLRDLVDEAIEESE